MIVMAAGAVIGGLDRIFGYKLGRGEQFEKGFLLLGPMALSMAGMICLAPVLANWLGRVIVPLYRLMGVDPAMFGSLLAMDMGGLPVGQGTGLGPAGRQLRRGLERPFAKLDGKLGLRPQSLTGMLVRLATPLPAWAMYRDMDERGKTAVGRFWSAGPACWPPIWGLWWVRCRKCWSPDGGKAVRGRHCSGTGAMDLGKARLSMGAFFPRCGGRAQPDTAE